MIKVKKPNIKDLCLVFLNSFISSSKPAINIIYSKPIVENKSTAEFFSNQFKPWGPIIIPEIINPIIPGTFIGRNRMGDNKMINNTKEKIRTGLVKGASKA
jgi:hypothetical protein